MFELALHRIREAKHKRLTRLDLGNCDLKILPDELFELSWLEELYLGQEGKFYDFKKNESIFFKTKNNQKANCLSDLEIPISVFQIFRSRKPSWKELVNLKILLLGGNKNEKEKEFRQIDQLKYLVSLQQLDISNTYVSDLKPIQHLNTLRLLNISSTLVKDLTPLKDLDNLGKFYTKNIPAANINDLTQLQEKIATMTFQQLNKKVHDLISKAYTEAALREIKSWAHQNNEVDLKDTVTQFYSQLSQLKKEINLGMITHTEANLQSNRINNGLLNLLRTIDNSSDIIETDAIKIQEENSIVTERKTLKIFLASSNELIVDRESFELHFGARKRKTFSRDIEVIIWEDFIDAMSKTRLQDEYNKAIRECDIFVMLFFTKVGMYTAEEFETAFGKFKEYGKPLIYTYFKNANIKTADISQEFISLLEFKNKLRELGHFATEYNDTTDLNFQFSNQLDKLLKKKLI